MFAIESSLQLLIWKEVSSQQLGGALNVTHYIILFLKQGHAARFDPCSLLIGELSRFRPVSIKISFGNEVQETVAHLRLRQWSNARFLNCRALSWRTGKGTVFCAAISCNTFQQPGSSSMSFSRADAACILAGSWDAASHKTLYSPSGDILSFGGVGLTIGCTTYRNKQ